MPRRAVVTNFEPVQTCKGWIQVGELIEAKIDVTDRVSGSRQIVRRNCYFMGRNDNDRLIVEHPYTHDQTVLMNGRAYKKV